MDLTSSLPYWLVNDGLVAVYPPLERDESCDVLVLGAGITGAIFAERLTREGLDVVVLDRRDVGQGSTSASTALLLYEIDTHLIDLRKAVGSEHADRAYLLSVGSVTALERLAAAVDVDCGFRRRRSIYGASCEDDLPRLRAELDARRELGIDVEWIGPRELREQYALPYPGALLSSTAATCDPYLLAHGLLKLAASRGARIYDRTEATEFRHESAARDSGVRVSTDRGFTIATRNVVMATGFESQRYLREPVASFKNTYALATQPLATTMPWPEDALFWETARPYLYLRTTTDRRFIAGGFDDEIHSPSRRDAQVDAKSAQILSRLGELFPQLPLENEFAWAGSFAETKDGLAYIGRTPEMPFAAFALGFGGNGITFSVIAGDIIADDLKSRTNADAEIFRFRR